MKTVLTFVAGLLLTLTTMAADRYPSVVVKTPRHYEIVIDGRAYRNDNSIRLDRMHRGMHTIKVYERSRGLFGIKMRLVSTKNFFVRNHDLRIIVRSNGYVDVDERGFDRRDRNWDRDDRRDDRRYDNDRDWDRNDRDYDRNRRGY